MKPTIILDKSALQALSLHEIGALNRYYIQNIAPTLVVEILGDLKKEPTRKTPRDAVAELAQKLSPAIANLNTHYRCLLQESLLGHTVPMDGRIQLQGGRTIETSDGQRGVVFEHTPEETALLKWRDRQFSEAEAVMAERWRSSTRDFDLDLFKNRLEAVYPKVPAISDMKSLFAWGEGTLAQDHFQSAVLSFILYEFDVESALAQRIFYRWETVGPRAIAKFAPYAYYCAQVAICFNMGLIHNLISTRPTNRVDLEYLYYLPFCHAFCSGDKFHHAMAPMFMRPDQRYFQKDQLKPDLAQLSDDLHKHGPAGRERSPNESITSALWADLKLGKMTEHGWISPEQQLAHDSSPLVDHIKSHCLGRDIPDDSIGPGKEDFIYQKFTILLSDPCPCGSRKTFEECHGKHVAEDRKRKSDQ